MYKLRSKRQKTAARETSENLFLLLTWLRCNCEVNFEKTLSLVVCREALHSQESQAKKAFYRAFEKTGHVFKGL